MKDRFLNRFFVLVFIQLFALTLYSNDVLELDVNSSRIELHSYVSIFEDKTKELDIDDVFSHQYSDKFIPNKRNQTPNFGLSNSSYWIRFKLKNNSDRNIWLLSLEYPHIDYYDVYFSDENGKYHKIMKTGDKLVFNSREVNSKNFVCKIDIPKESERTIYLNAKGSSAMQFPLSVMSEFAYSQDVAYEKFGYGIFFGVIAVMIIYNLLLFFSIRDRNYLYYVMFITSFFVLMASFSGLAYQYIWSNWPAFQNISIPIFISASVMLLVLLSGKSIDKSVVGSIIPKLEKPLIGIGLLILVLTVIVPYVVILGIAVIYICIGVSYVIWSSISNLKSGTVSSKLFVISWSALILGILLLVFQVLNILPKNFVTTNGVYIGFIIEVVLLSLSLASKIKSYKKEKEIAEEENVISKELLNIKSQKNIELKENMQKNLKRLVHERTIAIKENEQIFKNVSETVKDTMILLDEDGEIIFWNKAAERMFGFESNDIIGENVSIIFDFEQFKEEQFRIFTSVLKAKESGISDNVEIFGKNKDKHEMYLNVSLSSTIINGKNMAICIAKDISINKQKEDEYDRVSEYLKMYNETILKQKSEIESHRNDAQEQKAELEYQQDKIERKQLILNRAFESIEAKKSMLEDKSREVINSSKYALKIQESILPSNEKVKRLLPESFILYKPKELTSGDFYWVEQYPLEIYADLIDVSVPDYIYVSVSDCVGQGVPGALMSFVANSLLNHSLNDLHSLEPANILNVLNRGFVDIWDTNNRLNNNNDSMDISLISIDPASKMMQYAGANSPVYIVRENNIIRLSPDQISIGDDLDFEFTNREFQLYSNDYVYLFSDGYKKQFGGSDDIEFKTNKFKELLLSVATENPDDQYSLLEKSFENWQGTEAQVDDMLVIGFKIQ